jgi:predicted dehydrogenase
MEIGVIGLETQGHLHAEILDRMGHDVRGVDINLDNRERFADQFDTVTYENPSALFEAGVDAVWVTAPNKFSERPAVQAFERGLDVFVEKPLAHSVESARAVRDAAASSSGLGMVGYPDLFFNSVEALKERIDSGYFGEVYHVEARNVRREGIPQIGSWFTNAELAGGGALLDIGSNVVALVDYLLDSPTYADLQGVTRQAFGHRPDYWEADPEEHVTQAFTVDDSASAHLCTDDGRSVSLEIAWAANRPTVHEYYVQGTEAGAYLDLTDGNRVDHYESPAVERLVLYPSGTADGDGQGDEVDVDVVPDAAYNRQFAHFFDAIDRGEPPAINTIADGFRVQGVIDRIYDTSAEWPRSEGDTTDKP